MSSAYQVQVIFRSILIVNSTLLVCSFWNKSGAQQITISFPINRRAKSFFQTSPKFKGCLTKLPTAAQPNLDFVAPEAQLYCAMSPLADMFSVGMVLCAIHNDGHSLIESDQNPTTYARKLSEVSYCS